MISSLVNKLLLGVVGLSILGMFTTAYLVYIHYQPEAGSFCTINETINCDIVNKSEWSYFDLGFIEIPVSILGFLTYLIIGGGALMVVKKVKFQKIHSFLREGNVLRLLRYFAIFAFVFSLYLTYIEAFVLEAWCLLCVTHQFVIAIIAGLFYYMNSIIKNNKKSGKVCEFC